MPKRKKIVDATNRIEAPAKVTLDRDVASTVQLIGFAQACLASVMPLLTKYNYDPRTPEFMSVARGKDVVLSIAERHNMAIRYLRRNIEISTKAIEALGGTKEDESNSW